jgi:hypothetical protein
MYQLALPFLRTYLLVATLWLAHDNHSSSASRGVLHHVRPVSTTQQKTSAVENGEAAHSAWPGLGVTTRCHVHQAGRLGPTIRLRRSIADYPNDEMNAVVSGRHEYDSLKILLPGKRAAVEVDTI